VSDSETGLLVTGAKLSAGRDLYAGVHIGMHIGPVAMIYATAGYTNAKVRLRYNDGATTTSGSDERDGFRFGVGGEWRIGQVPFAVRAEYRYSDDGEYSSRASRPA
jgi:outer membrane immunogenic protein